MTIFGNKNSEQSIVIKENRFAFIGETDPEDVLLETRVKRIEMKELVKMNIMIFITEKTIRQIVKKLKIKDEDCFRNGGKRIILCRYKNLFFKNFNALSGYASLEKLKKDFNFKSETEAGIMKEYVLFLLKDIKLPHNEIAMSTKSRIAEVMTYLKTGDLFYVSNNSLPKTERERRVVFNFFKEKLIEKNGSVYGVLDHKKGYYENVLMIDLNNFYGYQSIAKKFLKNNPYQVINGEAEPVYDYLPDGFRAAIIHNYKTAKKKDEETKEYVYPKGVRNFFKNGNNLTIGRSENLDIYFKRSRKTKRNSLGPQHGFEIISNGIDDLNQYTKVFESLGATHIKRDTDGIAFVGVDKEKGQKIVDFINKQVVAQLLAAGLSEEDANCGIGQFKVEGYAEKYYQFGDKAYCYQVNGKIEITFAGMSDEEKEQVLATSKNFDEVVEKLKNRQIQLAKPIEINKKYELVEGFLS